MGTMVFGFFKKIFGKSIERKKEVPIEKANSVQTPKTREYDSEYDSISQDLDNVQEITKYDGDIHQNYWDSLETYPKTPSSSTSSLPTCGICGKKLGGMNLYRCYYCEGAFCEDHRMPEKHGCTNITPTSAEVRAGSTSISYQR